MARTAYTVCDEDGCDRSPANGDALFRVNPKGEKGIFMCREHADATWEGAEMVDPPKIVRMLDGWSEDHRKQIEHLAKIVEEFEDPDDWEWCLGQAEAIFKAGYRRICAPTDEPY